MNNPVLSDHEFSLFSKLIYQLAGIHMASSKKPLVSGRLLKRLKHFGMESFGEYYKMLSGGAHPEELQMAVDLLTTNETYFFREQKHFDFMKSEILPKARTGQPFRVWSAASSTGQEAYSIAMTLADKLGDSSWEIMGSDISTRVLETAQKGLYPIEQTEHIPRAYLEHYCLKGTGSQLGWFLIDRRLRSRTQFFQGNLVGELPQLGLFDVVFLRNVMIYFDTPTKSRVVERIGSFLKPGGYFMIGHSESLNGISCNFKMLKPSIYQKPS